MSIHVDTKHFAQYVGSGSCYAMHVCIADRTEHIQGSVIIVLRQTAAIGIKGMQNKSIVPVKSKKIPMVMIHGKRPKNKGASAPFSP
jgi:hypothetical protein